MQQERVAPRALEPPSRALGGVARIERPCDQDAGERTGRERRRGAPHDELRHGVAAHAAVPEQVRALGRDDVRRVRDNEVELLALDRLEEASGPRLDVVGPVQRRVEPRVGERPLVHVGRDHVLCVRGEQDRLDAVAGAEVEGALAAPAHGQVGEGDGRAVHAGYVVGVRLCGARVVGGDQQLVVRDEARRPVDVVPVVDEKPGTLEALPQLVADVLLDAPTGDGDAEQEEAEQHGELVRVAETSQVGRKLGRPGQELVARCEPLLDSQRLVARLPQQPRQLDGRLRARPGRVGATGRRDAADGLHGCAADRR